MWSCSVGVVRQGSGSLAWTLQLPLLSSQVWSGGVSIIRCGQAGIWLARQGSGWMACTYTPPTLKALPVIQARSESIAVIKCNVVVPEMQFVEQFVVQVVVPQREGTLQMFPLSGKGLCQG